MDTEKAHESEVEGSKNSEQSKPKKVAALVDKIKKIFNKKKLVTQTPTAPRDEAPARADKSTKMGFVPFLVLLCAIGFIVFGIYSLIDIFSEKFKHQSASESPAKSEAQDEGTHGDALSKFATDQKNITIAKEKLVALSLYTVFVQSNQGRRSVNVELYLEASDVHTAKVLNAHRDALEDIVNSFLTTLHEDDFNDPVRREGLKSKLIAYVDKNLLETMRAQKKFGPKLGRVVSNDTSHAESLKNPEEESETEEVKGRIETVYFTQLVMG